jgi:predicted ATPase
LIAVTGGPGAGKTAVLEVVRRNSCRHVAVLPEAATIVFGGGFRRLGSGPVLRAAQRAIWHVQRELERGAVEQRRHGVVICDRGTIDSLAYWPGDEAKMLADLGVDLTTELARYDAVIHLRTPPAGWGYHNGNPVRIETATQAAAVDARIFHVWAEHPKRVVIPSHPIFLDKLNAALQALRAGLPACCRAG